MMAKVPRPFKIIGIAGLLVVIFACSPPLVGLSLFATSQANYPNSTRNNNCVSDWPILRFDPARLHFVTTLRKFDCFYTPDPLITVMGWYSQQGWTVGFGEGTGNIVNTYQYGPLRILLYKQLTLRPSVSVTNILVTTGIQVDIGGP